MQRAFKVINAGISDLKTHNMQANTKLNVQYQNRYADKLPQGVSVTEIIQIHVDFYYQGKAKIDQESTSTIIILKKQARDLSPNQETLVHTVQSLQENMKSLQGDVTEGQSTQQTSFLYVNT